LAFGVLGIAGSCVGSTLSSLVPPHLLLLAFAALILFVAVLMLRRAHRLAIALNSGTSHSPCSWWPSRSTPLHAAQQHWYS
jgi:uncharacterized membrane protein YfcA